MRAGREKHTGWLHGSKFISMVLCSRVNLRGNPCRARGVRQTQFFHRPVVPAPSSWSWGKDEEGGRDCSADIVAGFRLRIRWASPSHVECSDCVLVGVVAQLKCLARRPPACGDLGTRGACSRPPDQISQYSVWQLASGIGEVPRQHATSGSPPFSAASLTAQRETLLPLPPGSETDRIRPLGSNPLRKHPSPQTPTTPHPAPK
jgi:hypothetical protein